MYRNFELGVLTSTTNHSADAFVGKLAIIAEMKVEDKKGNDGNVLVIMPHGESGCWRTSVIEDVIHKGGIVRVYTRNSRYEYRRAESGDLPSVF